MIEDLKVPEEMQDLMLDYRVGIACRDTCVNSLFRTKRAIKYGKDAEKARLKFWKMLGELYPQTTEGRWGYLYEEHIVRKRGEE